MVTWVLKVSRYWRGIDIVSFLRGSMVQNLLILILTVAIEHCGWCSSSLTFSLQMSELHGV